MGGLVLQAVPHQRSCHTADPLNTWMGRLTIPLWVGAISISESWISKSWSLQSHCTSHIFTALQCKPMWDWGLRKRRSVPPDRPCGPGSLYRRTFSVLCLIMSEQCKLLTLKMMVWLHVI